MSRSIVVTQHFVLRAEGIVPRYTVEKDGILQAEMLSFIGMKELSEFLGEKHPMITVDIDLHPGMKL